MDEGSGREHAVLSLKVAIASLKTLQNHQIPLQITQNRAKSVKNCSKVAIERSEVLDHWCLLVFENGFDAGLP